MESSKDCRQSIEKSRQGRQIVRINGVGVDGDSETVKTQKTCLSLLNLTEKVENSNLFTN